MTLSVETIDDLLSNLRSLPASRYREQTFMEIAGYPYFENVCSNVLQFYLQPSNEHGFGTLLLDALAMLINKEIVIDRQNIDVRREELTAEGNRIDIVIESDNFVFGIENKVFAGLKNPFDEYAEHLERMCKGRQVYKVLLSLRPIQPSPELQGFYPVSYNLFFQQVIANIGSYFLTAQEHHITFLRDFIQTMQNLQKSTAMDMQRLAYFRDNQQNIEMLLTEVNGLREEMREKVKQLKEITESDIDVSPYSIASGLWRSSTGLRDVIWYTVKLSDSLWLQFDVLLTPAGWTMGFYNRRGSFDQVKQWVEKQGIKVESTTASKLLAYKGECNSLPYEKELEVLRTWILNMLKKLTAPTT